MKNYFRVGFLGAGGIAQSHAYALDALKYYYADAPMIEKVVVASPTPESREAFASRFSFKDAIPPEKIWDRSDIDALYILGPNHTHTPQLLKAAQVPTIQRIYVEKPIGTSLQDIHALESLDVQDHGKFIMMGFQYLQKSPLRKALAHWQSGTFGDPIHFSAEYLHSSYLDPEYRQKHQDRLLPIPAHGAAADLGSHVLSLLTAFLGNTLIVKAAAASGKFENVPENTDLCTTALLEEPTTGAIGTLVASRVSSGSGDHLSVEIRGTRGAILYDTGRPDSYESYLPQEGWVRHKVLSNYLPASTFPANYAPSGWLRALIHNHILFTGAQPDISMIPDLAHGIQVQKLLQQIAEFVLAK
jgi:predicted dehydrogenase